MREISAGIIIYRKTEDGIKYLILYHRGQYWNFPKGKIESEERSFQTALREVREETGLERRDLRFVDYFKAYENFAFFRMENGKREKIYKTIIFYLAETNKKQVYLRGPHEEGFGWFAYKDALKVLGAYKDSRNVLKAANDLLTGGRESAQPAEKDKSSRNNCERKFGNNNGNGEKAHGRFKGSQADIQQNKTQKMGPQRNGNERRRNFPGRPDISRRNFNQR